MFIPCLLAYLDPGAGSMLLQAIVGGSAGILVVVRHLWRTWMARRNAATSTEGR